MPDQPTTRAILTFGLIVIAGLLVQAYGQSVEIAGLRDQLARIDRHDRARIEASSAAFLSHKLNAAPAARP